MDNLFDTYKQQLLESNDERLQLALTKFERIMEIRSELYHALAYRVRNLVRWGMGLMVVITFGLMLLMALLTTEIEKASQASQQMSIDVKELSKNMKVIRDSVNRMRLSIDKLPVISSDVNAIAGTTIVISESVQMLDKNMSAIEKRMGVLKVRVKNMSHSLQGMKQDVGSMGYNVNQMAKPFP